jgi:uncharacterized protein DUF993
VSAPLLLPTADGRLEPWAPSGRSPTPVPPSILCTGTEAPAAVPVHGTSRTAYAAVHVVADPLAAGDPGTGAWLDWDATLAFRHHIWSCGLGVAEAMDTAQRGMGLDWATARELIARTGAEAASVGGAWCAGVGTDQLAGGALTGGAPPLGTASDAITRRRSTETVDLRRVIAGVVDAWQEQLAVVVEAGGVPVIMASRALAAAAQRPDDYHRAYGTLLSEASGPMLLHWLGEPFDPALAGYWGHRDVRDAARELAALCRDHEQVVAGVKVSVLDAAVEVELRRSLPKGVACLTGDDFNFPELIAGDDQGHSDALLGIFDPVAAVAGAALRRLDDGDVASFRALLDPTVPLAREVFRPPTPHYKVGVVFLAYLSGHQRHFRMVGGLESQRSIVHLSEVLRLADAAGVLPDPDLAVARMRPLLTLAGLDA